MAKSESTGLAVSHARKVLAHQSKLANGEAGEAAEDVGELVPPDPAFLAPPGYKVRRRVTVPVLSFPVGATYVLRILGDIHTSEVEDSKFGPARICHVEAPSGEVRILICGEVLATALVRAYPDDGYVGAWFQVTKLLPREGKRYADYSIVEIEPPDVTQAASVAA